MNRRDALKHQALLAAGTALTINSVRGAEADKIVRVAVVGLGRGLAHVQALLQIPNAEISHLAEVDPARLATAMKGVAAKQKAPCQGLVDFRKCLDDATLDALLIALPNFWHTPAAVLALKAGKHVYVEKPGSQNPHEAMLIVEAATKYNRLVQMGNQRRTWMKDAIAALHAGAIGKLHFARCFYYSTRGAIGKGAIKADSGLDLNLWQGPVPNERDMKPFVHYDWHWLWHWGNGELGNNGVHHLDILRWGLKVEYPQRVSYLGGRYHHQDAQETPDTGTAVFDFGTVGMEWVQSSCAPRKAEKPLGECVFYGENGTFAISGSNWVVYDTKGEKASEGAGTNGGDVAHIKNFIDAIRGQASLNSPIAEGQKSTMLCHLGNIAYRTGTLLHCDPATGRIKDHPAAEKLWQRAYRDGWEPTAT